ncbi:MAG: hypothetical protein ACRD2A_05620 [Vicinamibacterales bacterium]
MTGGGEVRWIEVDCPWCGNVNRRARRACRYCKRTGKVMKSIPIAPNFEIEIERR